MGLGFPIGLGNSSGAVGVDLAGWGILVGRGGLAWRLG